MTSEWLKSNATHNGDKLAFRELMLQRAINGFLKFSEFKNALFFDRSIVDLYGYSLLIKNNFNQGLKNAINSYRYNSIVALFPPWQEIYCNDHERKQDFQEAIATYKAIKAGYRVCGYTILEVPKDTIVKRAHFIIDNLLKPLLS